MKSTTSGILPGSLFIFILALLQSSFVAAQRNITLDEFRQLAIRQNNNIKTADQNILVAESQKKQADTKSKFTIDGSVTGFYFGKPLNTLLPEQGKSGDQF